MTALDTLSWLQLTKVPRPAKETRPDDLRRQIFASLAGAYAELLGIGGQPTGMLAFCCLRPPGQRRLQYLVGGSPRFPPARTADGPLDPHSRSALEVPVLYPPGSTGVQLPASAVNACFGTLPFWTACLGEADVLWTEENDSPPTPLRAPFDDYVAHLPTAFAWLVIAEPLTRAAVEAERNRLTGRIPLLRQRENSEIHRIELERTQARYRELTKARASGVWSVRILVGGPDEVSVQRTAALLSSASDLEDVPYVLTPGEGGRPGGRVPGGRIPRRGWVAVHRNIRFSGVGCTSAWSRASRYPDRLPPGLRRYARVRFRIGQHHARRRPSTTLIPVDGSGSRTGRSTAAFVCGATGSGKSQTSRNLLELLSRGSQPVPWLVLSPPRPKYGRMAARLGPAGGVLTIRPGDLGSPPARSQPAGTRTGVPAAKPR